MPEFAVFIGLEQHTLELQKYGLKIEQLGKAIQEHGDHIAVKYGRLIEQCSKVVRQEVEEADIYIQVAIELAEEAQNCTQVAVKLEDYYTELITPITQSQLEARDAFSQALDIFAQMMQKRIELVGKHL
ncbi:hypothetical protein [Chroococcidiopsis sp. CCNUC1]|uniref:hypothetical protein n=1 Tax=Chroococcidiopsis sp. CCNUC1 TaxID=2653189 RepID=UPI002020C50E|nr:hypothetical protein [Chroococcidiopsis sp. CCNUC1]URD53887.1 hypothetical protein M5J74_31540 [Chroococcidiopsis sp. CCNUC1]